MDTLTAKMGHTQSVCQSVYQKDQKVPLSKLETLMVRVNEALGVEISVVLFRWLLLNTNSVRTSTRLQRTISFTYFTRCNGESTLRDSDSYTNSWEI